MTYAACEYCSGRGKPGGCPYCGKRPPPPKKRPPARIGVTIPSRIRGRVTIQTS